MGLYKDLYAETLENMITDYLEEHPNATWDYAYELLADAAYEAAMDKVADMTEYYADRVKVY